MVILLYIKPSNKGWYVPCSNRAVTKFLSCRVYAASRWETEKHKSSLCFILLMFHLKVARGHAHTVTQKRLCFKCLPGDLTME